MAWKATGQPTVRKQRDKWVVRIDGIGTVMGKHKPKQLGTYQYQRSAKASRPACLCPLCRTSTGRHGLPSPR